MSTSILPDDSVVVRMPDRTVHVDATRRRVHVRATDARATLGGCLVAQHDFGQVRRVRLVPDPKGVVRLELELHGGARLPLGEAPSGDLAMLTARAVADLCRCQLDAGGGVGPVLGASVHFTEASTFDAPTPGLGGVVPLAEPPSLPGESERITDEQPHPAPPRALARTDSLHRVTRELTKADVDAAREEPVFEALLRESELAQALDPAALAASLEPVGRPAPAAEPADDLKPTLVGIAAVGGRPQAVAELLNLAAERLPVATSEVPTVLPHRGRSRARPSS